MAGLTEQKVRQIVREEIAASPDIGGMKQDIGGMKQDIGGLKTDVSDLKTDVRQLGVKFEDFDHKMDAIAELVTTTVETRQDTRALKRRVEVLESDVALLKRPQ